MKILSILLLVVLTSFYFPFFHPGRPFPTPSEGTLQQGTSENQEIPGLEIPQLKPHESIIKHVAYTLSYNEAFEQANWVAYELTREETNPVVKRYNRFMTDPAVSTGTASSKDYTKSGFDTGHLAPAGDMAWSATSMKECFYYSNMSPQYPSFNRGIWKQLEEQVRNWAEEYASIYIVTGPVLEKGLPTIGPDEVAVPKYFYKVILDYHPPRMKGIGIIMKNEGSDAPLQSFAVTIDSVEKLTSLDFFPLLPDASEKTIEKSFNIGSWTW
jgi:endonuclease G, mitochondrial